MRLCEANETTIDGLVEKPYASVVCYPKLDLTDLMGRLEELRKLKVRALEFSGERRVSRLSVLGKGNVGIVTTAYVGDERVALKIRRTDADRSMMYREAEMLRTANSVNVGPEFIAVSENFLLMQFVDGVLIPRWLERPARTETQTRKALRQILEQCRRLDKIGLDHGELSHAPKHVIFNKRQEPYLLDFETASLDRKASNVTSICHFLFLSSMVAKRVSEKLGRTDKATIVNALREYNSGWTRLEFEGVLEACNL